MIKERRKDQQKASKRAPKKATNSDRSIATGRAKREAAVKANRGLSQTKKPNAMEVEREVYRQSRKTAVAKKNNDKKATTGRIAPDSSLRDKKKKAKKIDPPAAIFGGRTPSKKAVEAAIKGMESAGFRIPEGHQLMMTFIPAAVAPMPKGNTPKGKKRGPGGRGGKGNKGKP
jgi:hypothetical protein